MKIIQVNATKKLSPLSFELYNGMESIYLNPSCYRPITIDEYLDCIAMCILTGEKMQVEVIG